MQNQLSQRATWELEGVCPVRVLITGTNGQVSLCLQQRAIFHDDVKIIAEGQPVLDLLEPEAIGDVVGTHRPDIVVSAAAYTAVDRAEDEPQIAYAVNQVGARAVAAAAKAIDVPIIHLSTNYVFSGNIGRPYLEDDEPDPRSVYGASKFAGERDVALANDRHVILRVGWVYSPYGKNFVASMLKLAETQDEISVVDDQIGNPTSAFEIADALLHISRMLLEKMEASQYGVFHFASEREMSWAGFAEKIMEMSRKSGGPHAAIKPIPSSIYLARAHRPANSRLGVGKLKREFGLRISERHCPLAEIVSQIVNHQT